MADRRIYYYKKSLKALEFDKVLELLSTYASIDKTKELIKKNIPLYSYNCVKRMLTEVTQAKNMLTLNRRVPLANLSDDIDLYISKAVKGITLTPSDFMALAKLMQTSVNMTKYKTDSNTETDSLDLFFEGLFEDRVLLDRIIRTFPDGERVADDATPALLSIRRNIMRESNKIKDMLDKYIKNSDVSSHLQEPIVTIRYDRFVIPVRAESRGSIKGLVHDTSNSGSTLFVEPLFVIEANNKIRELENEEQREIEKILKELTELVAQYAHSLLRSYKSLISIDYIFAKARYSYDNDMCEPTLSKIKEISIVKARHPLISKDVMVPLDISFGGDTDTVIVTGPNTGGKTVFLKTLGLVCLMAKAGMHVPCRSANIFVFDRVYADIGDEQSIEQSLSTFSSHLKNIKSILTGTDSGCLVLFDELGSGTDPIEGAALAEAVIQKVRALGAYAACTTHYSELKTFALEEDGIKNASFEFDLETLSPTYRLNVGIPGKSYAFEISKHLGLQGDVIDAARCLVSSDVKRFDKVIDELLAEKSEYEKLRRELFAKQKELDSIRQKLDEKSEKIEKNTERELEAARVKARQLIEKARRESNLLLENLKKQKDEIDKASYQKMKSAIRVGVQKLDVDGLYADSKPINSSNPLNEVKVGQTVLVGKMSKNGEVVSVSGNTARVNCGGLIIGCNISDLYEPLQNKNDKSHKKQSTARLVRDIEHKSGMELDIRGEMVIDACEAIDRFLDDAVLDRLNTVTIIHGKGTGALRAGVHSHLKGHRQVKSFHIGAYGEGDSGVTIVELK